MQGLEFRRARLVPREFDHVADRKKFAETLLLLGQEKIGCLQFIQKFLRGPVGGMKIEAFLQIKPDGVRNEDAKRARLTDQRQGFPKFLPGAHMRRYIRNGRRPGGLAPPKASCRG